MTKRKYKKWEKETTYEMRKSRALKQWEHYPLNCEHIAQNEVRTVCIS